MKEQVKYQRAVSKFWLKVDKTDLSDCWLWMGSIGNGYGYGRTYWLGRRDCLAHRVVYEISIGPIPKGLLVCHKCDNPQCVNPNHLFLGTNVANMHDMVIKGRARNGSTAGTQHGLFIGESNPSAKLDIKMVYKLRELYKQGKSVAEIARLMGVLYSNTWAIVKRKNWTHI